MLIPMTHEQILKLYSPVEAYCLDCSKSTNYGVWIPKSLITVFDEDTVTYRDVIEPTITPLIK